MADENPYQLLYSIVGNIGMWFSFIYLFVFLRWKKRTKHKMRWNYILGPKWILIALTVIPFLISLKVFEQVTSISLEYSGYPMMVIYFYFVFFVLYEYKIVNKHELLLPLTLLWCPAIILLVYKRHHTELMAQEASEKRG